MFKVMSKGKKNNKENSNKLKEQKNKGLYFIPKYI